VKNGWLRTVPSGSVIVGGVTTFAEMVAIPPASGAVSERSPELSVVPVNGKAVSISTQFGIASGVAWRRAVTDLPEELSEPKMSSTGFVGKMIGPEIG
jgi:hypothetical protein